MEKAEKQKTYAENIARINDIVELLKNKDCDIDEMIKLVDEAADLIQNCQQKLGKTDVKIRQALERLGNTESEESPF